MNKALLVVDMQNICVGKNSAAVFKYDKDTLLENVNLHIKDYETVVYIKNIMKRNLINHFAPFKAYEGTVETELAEGLLIVSGIIFNKYQGDAFSNTELVQWIQKNNIKEIGIVGVDGGGCVALTAMGAIKNNLDVVLYEDAIGTTFVKKKNKYFKQLKTMGVKFA